MNHVEVGNLFSCMKLPGTKYIVHGCNAQGVMGSGVALTVRSLYPEAYEAYVRHVNGVGPGNPGLLGKVSSIFYQPQKTHLVNAITQLQFGKDGRQYVSYGAIKEAFSTIAAVAADDNATVHYPLIGAGLGGGNWSIISQIITDVLGSAGVNHTLWVRDEYVGM